MLPFKVVWKSQRMCTAQTYDLLSGGNVGRKQHSAVLVDVSKKCLSCSAYHGVFIVPRLTVFIYHKKTEYHNSEFLLEDRFLDMLALSDNFCIEISFQMNYFRKNKTTLMMFWPI